MIVRLVLWMFVALFVAGLGGGGWWLTHRTDDPAARAVALEGRSDFRGAVIEWRNAVLKHPESADAQLRLSEAMLRVYDGAAAEKGFRTAELKGADHWAVLAGLGEADLLQGKWQALLDELPDDGPTPAQKSRLLLLRGTAQIALRHFDAAQATLTALDRMGSPGTGSPGTGSPGTGSPGTGSQATEPLLLAAQLARATGDAATADAKVDAALRQNPRLLEALLLKTRLLMGRNALPQAIDMAGRAIEAAPWSLAPRLDRATLLMMSGDEAKARTDIDFVQARRPAVPLAVFLDAVLLSRTGKDIEANAALDRLGANGDQFPRADYLHATVAARLGNAERAMALATRYNARFPADREGILLLARTELVARRPDLAAPLLEKALANPQAVIDTAKPASAAADTTKPASAAADTTKPASAAADTTKPASAAADTTKPASAAADTTKPASAAPDTAMLALLGAAYEAQGNDAAALRVRQAAAAAAPGNPGVLTGLGLSQLRLGDTTAGMETLERSAALAPPSPSISNGLFGAALGAGDLAQAQAVLERRRAQEGETEAVGSMSALLLLARGDGDGARQAFEAVVKAYPDATGAKVNLAKLQMVQGHAAEADTLLQQILAKAPGDPLALAALVELRAQAKDYAGALTAVGAAEAATPGEERLLVLRASILVRSGDAKGAAALLETRRATAVLSPAALAVLARAEAAAGTTDAAITTYREILKAAPNDGPAQLGLLTALLRTNRVDEARATLRAGLAQSPGTLRLLQGLTSLELRTAGLDAALKTAAELRADPRNMPDAAILQGDVLMQAGQTARAVQAYRAEFDLVPSKLLALRVADSTAAAGQADAAATFLRAWAQGHPDDPDVSRVLARMDVAAGRWSEAQTDLEARLKRRPNDPIALNDLAFIYQTHNDDRALALAQQAYRLAPGPEIADTLGWIMLQHGDPSGALALLQRAQIGLPDNPAVAYHLAAALQKDGQPEESRKLLQSLVARPQPFEDRSAAESLLRALPPAR